MSLTPSPAAARPRRRSLLTGALGAGGAALATPLAAGCTDGRGGTDNAAHREAAARLRHRAARDSEHLLARYDGTAKVHPATAARLRPLRAEVARHARVLRGSESGTGSPSPSGAPGRGRQPGSGTGPEPSAKPPSPDTASVPEDERKALAALAEAERRLSAARTKALAGAEPRTARLLASIAACGAAHSFLLEEHGRASGAHDEASGGVGQDGRDDGGKGEGATDE
ncbi:hypothetical protein MMF93_24785 [Streptomyces tubbatahanensis]|uniref:Lipoprotein n=1 Tax=Streptomyces tubbatahanensis TaxID=2923272 RepID=A0ABY3XYJ2_9ACTN|nr:hypothetical protein [Streptomyces tubbatahanensis]UNS99313.1 hypothetical protein MMF93_24785 [Streptomyces tubbatahanensis]